MMPRCSPEGATTQMPPGPAMYTFPSISVFIPSNTPGGAVGSKLDFAHADDVPKADCQGVFLEADESNSGSRSRWGAYRS